MANLYKHVALLVLLITLELSGCVSGEISAEDVYDLLSRSIFKIENNIVDLKRRIENIEKKDQGISTTVSPQLDGSAIKEAEIIDLKEDMNMQALAIQKTLTAEKIILRDTVETFELKFAEFKSQIQHQISSINASLEGRSEVMFDIVNNSSITLENGIAELKSDLSNTTNNISQFLETMEITMMSNFEDMEKRMVANITMQQREIYDMANSSALALATGIKELKSDWNSTTNNIGEILQTTERTMQSNMKEIEKKITDDVARKQSTTQTSLNSLQNSFNSLSSTVSSISNKHTYTIQPELTSLSSRISSVSSSLSSSVSSLSARISAEEELTVAFDAHLITPDSYYIRNETINDFDIVITNTGNGFDRSTGIFTAPRSGIYLFILTISPVSDELLIVDIKHDGYQGGSAKASKENTTGTRTVIRYLHKGNRVWVQTSYYGPAIMHIKSHYTTFHGCLIG